MRGQAAPAPGGARRPADASAPGRGDERACAAPRRASPRAPEHASRADSSGPRSARRSTSPARTGSARAATGRKRRAPRNPGRASPGRRREGRRSGSRSSPRSCATRGAGGPRRGRSRDSFVGPTHPWRPKRGIRPAAPRRPTGRDPEALATGRDFGAHQLLATNARSGLRSAPSCRSAALTEESRECTAEDTSGAWARSERTT